MSGTQKKRMEQGFLMFCKMMPVVGGLLVAVVCIFIVIRMSSGRVEPIVSAAEQFPELNIQEDYLTVNRYSRPGNALDKVDKVVIHYTGNPGSTAQANRDYFESLATNPVTSASSHFVIGLDGEIIQCIPLNEISYASNSANAYSISIECCHPDETGEFETITYNRCVELTAQLCYYYHLDPERDVIRHYDVTGKECPLFYVQHPDEWEMFVGFVERRVDELSK